MTTHWVMPAFWTCKTKEMAAPEKNQNLNDYDWETNNAIFMVKLRLATKVINKAKFYTCSVLVWILHGWL